MIFHYLRPMLSRGFHYLFWGSLIQTSNSYTYNFCERYSMVTAVLLLFLLLLSRQMLWSFSWSVLSTLLHQVSWDCIFVVLIALFSTGPSTFMQCLQSNWCKVCSWQHWHQNVFPFTVFNCKCESLQVLCPSSHLPLQIFKIKWPFQILNVKSWVNSNLWKFPNSSDNSKVFLPHHKVFTFRSVLCLTVISSHFILHLGLVTVSLQFQNCVSNKCYLLFVWDKKKMLLSKHKCSLRSVQPHKRSPFFSKFCERLWY